MPLLAAALLLARQPVADAIKVTVAQVYETLHPVAYAPAPFGSKFAACMEDGSVRIIDSKTRQTIRTLAKHPQTAYAVAWSPDGNFIATGDESARIWIENANSGQKVREYRTHTKGIQKLSYNLPGTLLISTGKDDQVNVYDLTSKKPKEARAILGHGQNFYGATFHPKFPTVFTVGTLSGGASIYNAVTGQAIGHLIDHNSQGTLDIAYNPNGTRTVSADKDGFAVLWDAKTYGRVGTFKGHQDWVVNTVFSPNGKLVATASSDRTVRIWNPYNFQKIAELPGEMAVGSPMCFTADGKTLMTVSDMGGLQYNKVTPAQPSAN